MKSHLQISAVSLFLELRERVIPEIHTDVLHTFFNNFTQLEDEKQEI